MPIPSPTAFDAFRPLPTALASVRARANDGQQNGDDSSREAPSSSIQAGCSGGMSILSLGMGLGTRMGCRGSRNSKSLFSGLSSPTPFSLALAARVAVQDDRLAFLSLFSTFRLIFFASQGLHVHARRAARLHQRGRVASRRTRPILPNPDHRMHYHTHTLLPHPRDRPRALESAGKRAEPRRTTQIVLSPPPPPLHHCGFSTHGLRSSPHPSSVLHFVSAFTHPPANPAAPGMFYCITIYISFRLFYVFWPSPYAYA